MSDQSYDRVRQQIKNLGLKHKGGGSYEKDGKYFGRVTKQGGQYILKKAGEVKKKEKYKGSKAYDQKDKEAAQKYRIPDPDNLNIKQRKKVYDDMIKFYGKIIKKDDKEGQKLLQKIKDRWEKQGNLGSTERNYKVWQGSSEITALDRYIQGAGESEDETGPETDVKDEPKSIDKVTKKTYEVIITIPYENTEGGMGQGGDIEYDDDEYEKQPEDVEIIKKIKAVDDEEAEARADVEADEAFQKLEKRNKYDYHKPDYEMMNVEVSQISESYERNVMVKENIKNFVNALHKGDNIKAGEAFKGTMADKVTSALDNQKVDVAKSLFTGAVGFKAPEANVFSGNDLEAETSTPDVGAGNENAQ